MLSSNDFTRRQSVCAYRVAFQGHFKLYNYANKKINFFLYQIIPFFLLKKKN